MSVTSSRNGSNIWSILVAFKLRGAPLVTLAIGLAATAGAFSALRTRGIERERGEFQRLSNEVASDVRSFLDRPLEVLESVCALFHAADHVSRSQFASFSRPALDRHPGLRALEWIPLVSAEGRSTHELAARAEGLASFQFTETTGDGSMVRATERPEYLPIYYMEPPDERVLGFDLASEAARRAPVDRATAQRASVASERIRLVEDPPSSHSIAVFCPVFTRSHAGEPSRLRGVSAEVFRVRAIVEPAVARALARGVEVVLLDPSAPFERRVLFESAPGLALGVVGAAERNSAIAVDFADRRWSLVFTRGPRYYNELREPPWVVGASGFMLSILAALVVAAGRGIRGLRREVHATQHLGQYTLVRKLGEGGLGVVWEARHALLRRPAALKLLKPGQAGEDALTRFEREVQLTSELTHPNTVAIYDYGHTAAGLFYYVMEYLDGPDLQRIVEIDGAQAPARVVHIMKQVAGALAEAHARGLVHRDVKPANIVLCERGGMHDTAKVVDFGLVKASGPRVPALHSDAAMVGTPLFMSPEAISDPERVDARSDVYACGAVAYYLLTGHPVFERETLLEICSDHLYADPVPPSQRCDRPLPQELERLVLRCLAKNPAARIGTASELQDELARCRLAPWTEQEARAASIRVAAQRLRLSAAAMAPTLPASSPGVLAVDFGQRRRSGPHRNEQRVDVKRASAHERDGA